MDGWVAAENRESPPFGLRPNWGQFVVLSLLTFWVGSVVGVERVVVPALGTTVFHVSSFVVLLSFIVSFGFVKAAVNLLAGSAADRMGRRRLLLVGWVVAVPVPFLLVAATSWSWVIVANVLVGVNQGLAWSMAVTSKIDLAGARQRGIAMGLNEFAGYSGVTVGGFAGGLLGAFAFRTAPAEFLLAVVLVALATTFLVARETREFARREGSASSAASTDNGVRPVAGVRTAFALASWRDRRLVACSQAGLVEKFVDTLAWGLFPVYLLGLGFPLVTVGVVTGAYTGSWAVLQLVFGPLSDRWGRRTLIVLGMALAGFGVFAAGSLTTVPEEIGAALAAGTGMAMLYPTLLAAVADYSRPQERGAVLGVYRFWRDSGYGFGGLALGVVADRLGFGSTFAFTAALMGISAAIFAWVFWGSTAARKEEAGSRFASAVQR